ncbi:MAG TPA: flagella assembly protein FlgT middle domain-containing protein [Cellvibrionaceae bacterium]
MKRQYSQHRVSTISGKMLPLWLCLCLFFAAMTGCTGVHNAQENKTDSREISDAAYQQYMQEWQEAKPSIDRLTGLENDLAFLLAEVSKMSDLNNAPEQYATGQSAMDVISAPYEDEGVDEENGRSEASQSSQKQASNYPLLTKNGQQCPDFFSNSYRKSIAFTHFPRALPSSSNAGGLYQVDQHLPMLLSANLRTRHSALTPVQIQQAFYSADHQGEVRAASQAKSMSRQHRIQFIVSGEVLDMSMTSPDQGYARGAYANVVKGIYNTFHLNSPSHTQSRVFSFRLQLRDGFTGQILFDQLYETRGKWKAVHSADIGFGSPRFWQTDYGQKIQQLVAAASDQLAAAVLCQPYIARVDIKPGDQQVVIHSGTNNGLRTGDTLELYQLVVHPVTGEYNSFNSRLISRNTLASLVEVYPSHSIANISNELPLNGQYLVMAP